MWINYIEKVKIEKFLNGNIFYITIDSFQSHDRLEDLEGKTSTAQTSVSIFHLFPSRKYFDHLSKD